MLMRSMFVIPILLYSLLLDFGMFQALESGTSTTAATTVNVAGELSVEAVIGISPVEANREAAFDIETNQLPEAVTNQRAELKLQSNQLPTATDKRCGIRKIYGETKSNEAQIGQWPWIVALYYGAPGGKTHLGCVGSLISPRHVLTVAKCVDREDVDLLRQGIQLMEARVGDVNLIRDPDCSSDGVCADPSFVVPVSAVHLHPALNKTTSVYTNDFAIATLAKPIHFTDFVRAICLPFEISLYGVDTSLPANKNVETAGWGTRGPVFFSQDNPVLYHKVRRIVPEEECTDWHLQDDSQVCTAISGGLDLLCTGGVGYGAPLVGTDSLGRSIILGALSAERRLCPGSRQTVYADVVSALSWIFEILHS